MFHYLIGAGVGFVVGAFTPGVLRKIKSLFVSETTKVKADVKTEVAAAAKKL
jgi:hypothetical protein